MTERKPAARKRDEDKPAAVFLHTQVIALPAEVPGPDTAAVLAAIQSGRRPTSPAYVETTEDDLLGDAVRVTWAVPVEAA